MFFTYRVSLDILSVQANTGPKWDEKINKAFWRGRDSREERLNLVIMGRKKPKLYDVGLTNFFFFPYDEKKYGPKHKLTSFFDFFKVKFQDFFFLKSTIIVAIGLAPIHI